MKVTSVEITGPMRTVRIKKLLVVPTSTPALTASSPPRARPPYPEPCWSKNDKMTTVRPISGPTEQVEARAEERHELPAGDKGEDRDQ